MLIYNNNLNSRDYDQINIAEEEKKTIPLLYKGEDIDTIFSKLIEGLKDSNFDILVIPFSLSENYLSFLGLRLAYHIRLSSILGTKQNVPIILFGDLTPYSVNKESILGEILFTEGVYYSNESNLNNLLQQHKSQPLKGLTNRAKFIERIRIEAPANYSQSHHGITNEWAITRIANATGMKDRLSDCQAFKNIQNFLYYKYLNEKYPVSAEGNFSLNLSLPRDTSILYIDDEYEKGWKDLLKSMFSSVSNLTFKTLEEDFKSLGGQQKIIDKAIEEIKSNPNYDIILLDLRLHDIDFEQTDITEMTGYKILEEIRKMDKGINKGISVIIFTASNKAWNYKTLMDIGADGYFIKESPENSIDENYTVENLKQFQTTLQNAVAKTTLLKPYWDLIAKIKNRLNIPNKPSTQIEERINERLDMFFGLLKKGFERSEFDKSLFHYSDYELAFLTLWSVFNEVQEAYFDEKKKKYNEWDWRMSDANSSTVNYFLEKNKSTLCRVTKIGTNTPDKPYYKIDAPSRNLEWIQKIDYQIAYILLVHSLFNGKNINSHLILLYEQKEVRNKLYLTHGEDTNSDFFNKTEKEKREDKENYKINPQSGGDIHKLFNLVAFVLTGDDTIKLS